MLWLARSLAKVRGETQPFIGIFLKIILLVLMLIYIYILFFIIYVFDCFTHLEKCLVLYNPFIYRRLRAR